MKDTDAVVIVNESTLLLGPNSETATAAVGDDIEGQPPSSPDKPDRHHEELRFAGILTVLLVGLSHHSLTS